MFGAIAGMEAPLTHFLKDTLEAYKQLDISSITSVSDDFIIGRYRSRMEDTGPAMQPHLKAILKTLGNARQSQKLLDAASDGQFSPGLTRAQMLMFVVIKTYDQALAWLGAEHGYADESILTLHTAKVSLIEQACRDAGNFSKRTWNLTRYSRRQTILKTRNLHEEPCPSSPKHATATLFEAG